MLQLLEGEYSRVVMCVNSKFHPDLNTNMNIITIASVGSSSSQSYPQRLRNLECLNLLLNTGADFNRKDSFGRFVAFNHGAGLDLDLSRSNVNKELSCVCVSRTPLHYAAANCNYQCLFALVGSGASVNDLDERGCTPLHYAAASDTDGK